MSGWGGWFQSIRAHGDVSKTLPTDGQILEWDATLLQWVPVNNSGGLTTADFVNYEIPTPAPNGSQTMPTTWSGRGIRA